MARTGTGTIIGRKSVSKGKEYTRIWIYIPTKVSEDTAFPFKVGFPCRVEIDERRKQLVVKPISEDQTLKLGLSKRRKRQE